MNERSPKIGASVILQYKEKSMLEPLNASYPVLPLRDIVVFPHMIVPLFVGRDKSVRALEEVMADHEGTAVGQRAAYRMGIYYRDAGDFEGAIAAFEEVNVGDDVVQVLAAGNIGDCYVELADYEAAQAAFNNAISLATSSMAEDVLAPMFLYKGALVEIELGNNALAKKHLDRIVEDYPTSQQNNASEALAASLAEG